MCGLTFWAPTGPSRFRKMEPFFLVWTLFGRQKHESCKIRKSFLTPNGSTISACCSRQGKKDFASQPEKVAHRKNAMLTKKGLPHFYMVFSNICGTIKNMAPRPIFGDSGSENGPPALMRIRRGPFWVRTCVGCSVPWSVRSVVMPATVQRGMTAMAVIQ